MSEPTDANPAGSTPEELRQMLLQRSVEDEELRQRLLADPKATIEQETGARLPEEIEVRCVEETPDTIHLVLPPRVQDAAESGGLSDQQLDAVAGGWRGSVEGGTQYGATSGCASCDDPIC
ncbi:MAG: NHLP leader peptide family RiPP precursor [Rubrobacteraceae bacterium]